MCKKYIVAVAMITASMQAAKAETLDMAVHEALATQPRVLAQRYAIAADNDYIRQMNGQYWPSVDFSGGVGPEYANNTSTRADGGSTNLTSKQASIDVSETIFDGGLRASQVSEKESIKASDTARLAEIQVDVSLQAVEAYLNVLREQNIVDIYNESIEESEDTLMHINRMINTGTGKASDSQLLKSTVASNKSHLAEAKIRYDMAATTYFEIIGQKPNKLMAVVVPDKFPKTFEEVWDQSKDNNPGVIQAEQAVETAKARLKEAGADYYPTISLDVGASIQDSLDGIQGVNKSWNAVANVSYNLFSGGADRAEISGYQNELKEAQFLYDSAVRRSKQHVEEAYSRVEYDKQILAELNNRVDENKKVVSSFEKEFELGQRELVDITNAKNNYYNAQIEQVNAKYTDAIDRYSLLAVMGHLVDYLDSKK